MSNKRTRGLLSNSRRTAAPGPSNSSNSLRPRQIELPEYEPLECPLNGLAQRSLTEIQNNRSTGRKYEAHLQKSTALLKQSIVSINERVQSRSQAVERMEAKRLQRKQDKTELQVNLESTIRALQEEIPDLSAEIEASFRHNIDRQAEFVSERQALRLMAEAALTQPRRAQTDKREDEGDTPMGDEQNGSWVGAIELLETARGRKAEEWTAMSAHQRYALDNDYISFKRSWHDALHQDDNIPLPDASAWFDNQGWPVLPDATGLPPANGDEDVIVAREVRSFSCPLTLMVMKEPYSNRRCQHTYEKSAILEFLKAGPKTCPQAGCSQVRAVPNARITYWRIVR
jgi:E3 SUMO-protein ligase NSE2